MAPARPLAGAIIGLGMAAVAPGQSFEILPDLPGGNTYTEVFGVSANGQFVVGTSDSANGREAFSWSLPDGLTALGSLESETFFSEARDISDDGETVVGISWLDNEARGFVYEGGVMEDFGFIETGEINPQSRAFAITPDGSLIAGSASRSTSVPAVIKDGDDWLELGTLDTREYGIAYAHGISSDGSVAVGQGTSVLGFQAFTWDPSGGIQGLGFLDDTDRYSDATAVSGDGLSVVGWSNSGGGEEAFLYRDGSMLGLGDDLINGIRSIALDVDFDGSTIVGRIGTANGFEAGVWLDAGEPLRLEDYLESVGIDVPIELSVATGISADGNTIVGNGFADGNVVGWVARIPEPSVAGLILCASALFLRRSAGWACRQRGN